MFEVIESFGPRLSPLDWVRLARGAATLRRHAGMGAIPLGAKLRGRKHTRSRDRQAIQHHYDVSNRFYTLWLDKRLMYSCGYFPEGDETLDEAQEAKLEHICRKLRLKPGERLLDIGCGWGGLVIYAAEHYGVHACGITLSQAQLDEAQKRVEAAGLTEQVTLELRHYRDLDKVSGPAAGAPEFDKLASIGMAEHVGLEQQGTYFKAAWTHLKPGGLMLNHAISLGVSSTKVPDTVISGELTQRYIFPDGAIIPLWQSLRAAEEAGFEVRDVENLREHYARTLRCWARNLEAHWEEAVDEVGLELARLRRFHLSAAAVQFAFGHTGLHQSLLAKPDPTGKVGLPPTRADLYLS